MNTFSNISLLMKSFPSPCDTTFPLSSTYARSAISRSDLMLCSTTMIAVPFLSFISFIFANTSFTIFGARPFYWKVSVLSIARLMPEWLILSPYTSGILMFLPTIQSVCPWELRRKIWMSLPSPRAIGPAQLSQEPQMQPASTALFLFRD